ncbi:cadmium resistance transporter [Acidicapsa acidisoli]|uniref:cadmium resistance transporter n=1 Tax=Acidicapsa acidisoli TaxID=1615681 RepID=UPI0021E06514|nr:cadmium resistance transporter [Acidicapsa acidisoli]
MALVGLALLLFASTNVDDIFVLVGFFSDPRLHVRDIVIGQYVGIAALFGVSVAVSLLSLVIPSAYMGLLGIAPILIGAKKLLELYRSRDRVEESLETRSVSGAYMRTTAVALVTIANGGDNIGVYTPTFAIRSGHAITMIALVFAVMTALWCFIAHSIVSHPKLGAPIRRYGHRVAPMVLISLGFLILFQSGSVGLLLQHA